MASEITKLKISFLLNLASSDNLILSVQRKYPRVARVLKILFYCTLISYIYYHLFFSKNFTLSSFLGVIASGVGVAQFFGFLNDFSDALFYVDHKNGFLKNLSIVDFIKIMRPTRDFLGNSEENNLESNFISSLNARQQLVLLKLGAPLCDLPYLKTENEYAAMVHLEENSLQWMAMKTFAQTQKPFPFELQSCPHLEKIYLTVREHLKTDNDIVSEAQKLTTINSPEDEQKFIEAHAALDQVGRYRMMVG